MRRGLLSRTQIVSITAVIAMAWTCSNIAPSHAQEKKKEVIPHAQDKPPNEPRDPQTAAKMMTVPDGFSVEVVAAEPDIVNPVAMTIDERGRFWITESLEYPRKAPGPGKDRVKILEDTDGDGKCDKFTVFLDGLNIPSGVAVGHGGVWIANSPDILFVPDADRDGKPDGPPQVVVTGFGRTDTHELPNSLTWGPDGWLYGLNGVFNYSKVTYPKDSPWLKKVAESLRDSKDSGHGVTGLLSPRTEFTFTCAMFRIHPRTREFQVFAEGTSNPWGIAFNDEGEAFVSACVIDHLWHIVETGYYHRQGGPYPPFTWKIDSIVKHKHQKAAYCGIHYFDSDAYPEPYRGKLYMGNIHGGCINVDKLQRDGSTYFATGEPDFLTANDAWFMPVVQKTGPDGCLYILDWYDRYHCYQDANRDPAGIDRLKGRLYRVRYKDSPRTPKGFDLAKDSLEKLIERLDAPNDYVRSTAERLLYERWITEQVKDPSDGLLQTVKPNAVTMHLWELIDDAKTSNLQRRHAVFTLAAIAHSSRWHLGVQGRICDGLEESEDPVLRVWALRMKRNNKPFRELVETLVDTVLAAQPFDDPAAVNTDKITPAEARELLLLYVNTSVVHRSQMTFLLANTAAYGDDKLIPKIAWGILHPRLEEHADLLIDALKKGEHLKSKPVADLMPRVVDRILGRQKFDAQPIGKLFALLRDDHPQVGREVLAVLAAKVQSGELKGDKLEQLKTAMFEPLTPLLTPESKHPLSGEAAILSVSWGNPEGIRFMRSAIKLRTPESEYRLKAFNALISAKDESVVQLAGGILSDESEISNFKSQILTSLAKLDDPKVADLMLSRYAKLEPELQPAAIELLTQRANWSKQLLSQVGEKKIAATAINVNQARRIQALKDKELNDLLSRHWGQVRDTRNPDRERVVAEMKSLIRQQPGDPFAGEKVFKRVCAACHKIYGEGPDIGPDITSNGRNDFNQLLSNVFDPSLVIGAGYRVCTVVTKAGRVQSGLLVEDSPQRVVLKPAAVAASSLGLRPETVGKDAEKKKAVGTESQPTVTVAVGKLEIIPRDDIDEFKLNELSLMPEGLEKQLTPQEIVDLFAFLTLDKHPSDKSARRLPGVSAVTPRGSTNAAEFNSLIAEILPGFTTNAVGEGGVALLNNHFGRDSVLRTHPVSRDTPCVLTQKLTPPAGKKTTLILDVAHDPRGDWRLVVRANGERAADEMISKETCSNGWRTIKVDLTKFAGQDLTLGLVNQANDWSYEFAYWGAARIVSE